MESNFARANLSLSTMDKVSVLSIGHGQMTEKSFYELLQLNSVRVLYDFRASDHRGDVHAPCEHFSVRALKSSCRMRGIAYKHVALGRESAYGILKHVKMDEAQHALVELAWHGKRSRSCFLGFEPDWRLDHRQVVADELVSAGHTVKHIDSTGRTEDHNPLGPKRKLPDFIVQEEERLRKPEKQRQAGELQRQEKSAVDRSSEAVASKLMQPSKEIDAMDELRAASNQVELERVQRNLARLQRLGDKHGALAHKVVKAAPQWVLDEARQQAERIAKKKAEKAEKSPGPEPAAESAAAESAESHDAAESLVVECATCSVQYPWNELAEGDGVCKECLLQKDLLAGVSQHLVDEATLEQWQSQWADCDAHLSASSSDHAGTASTSVGEAGEAGSPGSDSPDVQLSPPKAPTAWRRRAKHAEMLQSN